MLKFDGPHLRAIKASAVAFVHADIDRPGAND